MGSGGNLPIYSSADALGQALLYRLNGKDLTEIYVAHEQLRREEHLQLLLSCDRVLVFTTQSQNQISASSSAHPDTSPTSDHAPKELRIMINISHVDLVCARTVSSPGDTAISEDTRYYIGELNSLKLGPL